MPTVLLAGSRGHGRLIGQLALTVAVTLAGLWLQYVISTHGTGAAASWSGSGCCFATGYRVLLFPSLLCALAVPLLAGASMDRGLAAITLRWGSITDQRQVETDAHVDPLSARANRGLRSSWTPKPRWSGPTRTHRRDPAGPTKHPT